MNIFCTFAILKFTMMKSRIHFNFFLFIMLLQIISSCSSKKSVIYMQDLEVDEIYSNSYDNYLVKVDDVLKIDILTEKIQTEAIINPATSASNSSKESMIFEGYQVDSEGFINVPSVGIINVNGKTIKEIRENIYKIVKLKGLLLSPLVNVRLLNAHFTIIGEVKSPGKYDYYKNNMNILEAIGIAGDLTINGKRNDIKVIRDLNGKKSILDIDLTNVDFLKSNKYQIISGDIIIVNPNSTRIKNAGIIGNSGTLLSLLSFILSSIIVISN